MCGVKFIQTMPKFKKYFYKIDTLLVLKVEFSLLLSEPHHIGNIELYLQLADRLDVSPVGQHASLAVMKEAGDPWIHGSGP